MTNRAHAIDAAVAVIDRGEFRAELARLVSIPTESQNPIARQSSIGTWTTS